MKITFLKKFFSKIGQVMKFRTLFGSRFRALAVKEITELLRNKQFLFILLFPPTIQLCLYGFILSPEVKSIKIGVVDNAKVLESREFISALSENKVFIVDRYLNSQSELGKLVENGKLSAGLVIPPEFPRDLRRGKTVNVQFFVDGVNAYIAGIASGYIGLITYNFNLREFPANVSPVINPQIYFVYNPGMVYSWFYVLGVMGMILTLTSSLSSSVESIREKASGTLEQLLMTPASSLEILLAKIIPIFILLNGVVITALIISQLVFDVPVRGSILLFLLLSGLYLIIGISTGLLLGTIAQNNMQVILTGFFINLPIIILSGAITPIESMPVFFRYITLLNPLRHYIVIIRGILLKGVGLEILWPEVLALLIFAIVLLAISSYKFRSQLS